MKNPSMWPLWSSPLAYFFLPGIFWILSHIVQSHPAASFGAQLSPYPCLYTDSDSETDQYRLTVS
jgi:hypothetical protein